MPIVQILKASRDSGMSCLRITPQPKCQVVAAHGELVEWQNRNTSVGPSQEDKVTFYRELKGYADERAKQGRPYARGWVGANFKDKYQHYPPNGFERHSPLPPGRATRNWIKHKQIAFAKRRGTAA
jgi:hypothetical protein